MKRFGKDFNTVQRSKTTFDAPLKWKEPAFVFACSWSDWFLVEADRWRDEAWDIIRATPHLTYLILTKRPHEIKHRLPEGWDNGWPNVWLGVSVESQKYTYRMDELLRYPAAKHFVSMEPLLERVDIGPYLIYDNGTPGHNIDWVIAGCESGLGARECKISWIKKIRDDCSANDVPFFLKQMMVNGRLIRESLLDGKQHTARPEIKNA